MRYHGKYESINYLGEGSTAKVHLVRDLESDRLLAMKECREISLIRQESEILKSLSYPAFPRWTDYFEEESGFLVMEYIEGISLQEYLTQKGKLEIGHAVELEEQILKCLAYLHKQKKPLIYRDLKPANMILDREGCVRMIDVGGVAKTEGAHKPYKVGTYGYAAPEQFWDGIVPGPECDLYAAGKVLAFMLTGKDPCIPPYDMLAYCERDRNLNTALFGVIQRSLAQESMGRYSSAGEFLRDLQAAERSKGTKMCSFFMKKQNISYEKCIWKSEYERIF